MSKGFWNGQPAEVRRLLVIVGDDGRPASWAKGLIGQEHAVVEVKYGDRTFYLPDTNGAGWHKVTTGYGSPSWGHGEITPERIVSEIPESEPCHCGSPLVLVEWR